MKLDNHPEQDSMKRHYESLVKVIEKKLCLCCDDTQLKKAGWPLEATVIIKPWATSPGRHHSLLFLIILIIKTPASPLGFIVAIITTMMMIRMLIRGVIIKGRWSPGLTTSLRWFKLIISGRDVGGHTSFSHHLKSYQFILGGITLLAIQTI